MLLLINLLLNRLLLRKKHQLQHQLRLHLQQCKIGFTTVVIKDPGKCRDLFFIPTPHIPQQKANFIITFSRVSFEATC